MKQIFVESQEAGLSVDIKTSEITSLVGFQMHKLQIFALWLTIIRSEPACIVSNLTHFQRRDYEDAFGYPQEVFAQHPHLLV